MRGAHGLWLGLWLGLGALALAGCATTPPSPEALAANDPYEQTNREMLKFNGKTGMFISSLSLIGSENFAFGLDGNLYTSGFPGIDRFNTSGILLNNFVPRGSGGLSGPGAIVFVPEPGMILAMVSLSTILPRPRPNRRNRRR